MYTASDSDVRLDAATRSKSERTMLAAACTDRSPTLTACVCIHLSARCGVHTACAGTHGKQRLQGCERSLFIDEADTAHTTAAWHSIANKISLVSCVQPA
jgi:hypothetical protein